MNGIRISQGKLLMRWRDKVSHFFFAQRPMQGMAICRVVFGISVFFNYVFFFFDFKNYYGPAAISGSTFYDRVPWAVRLGRDTTANFDWLFSVSEPAIFLGLYCLLLIMSVWFTIGFYTRTSGLLVLLLHTLLHANNELLFWGWGELIKPFLIYCILSDPGRWYSVDSWLKSRKWRPTPDDGEWQGPAWRLRLFQIHVTTVYIVAAWTRIDDPNWLNGSMLHGILTDSIFSRIDSDFWPLKELLRITCYGAWVLEIIAPFTLWFKRTQVITALALILMHIGLEVLTQVGYWNFIMIAALTHFLIPHSALKKPFRPCKV